jgi:hypothetical protein
MDRDHFLYASKKRRETDPNSLTFGKSKAAGKAGGRAVGDHPTV